jgi:predicted nucleic acid-binding protein
MRVVDTSIWIEILNGSELGSQHKPLLLNPKEIIVPTIVQYEIYKWLAREQTIEDANRILIFTGDCQVMELTTAVAVFAAELSATHRLHSTDAIIYATALMHDVNVLTCDAHFKDLHQVNYVSKLSLS